MLENFNTIWGKDIQSNRKIGKSPHKKGFPNSQ